MEEAPRIAQGVSHNRPFVGPARFPGGSGPTHKYPSFGCCYTVAAERLVQPFLLPGQAQGRWQHYAIPIGVCQLTGARFP